MKKVLFTIVGLFIVSSMSQADQKNKPVMSLIQTPGFTLPEFRKSMECKIYKSRVVIKKSVGGELGSRELKRVKLLKPKLINKLIERASEGDISLQVGPTDAPGYKYSAQFVNEAGEPQEVLLSSRSHEIKVNESTEAKTLVNFINMTCGN